MKNLKYYTIALSITLFACNSDDDKPVNEEEVITTVTTTLTGADGIFTLVSRDLDGDGPNAPVVTVSGSLSPNTTYAGTVEFLNELESPAEDITVEVEEEGEHHQLFYQSLPSVLADFTYTDADLDGNPVGLSFTMTTGDAGTGSLVVTLRHEPNKGASGVSEGDITNAGGSTDAQATYPIVIED